MLRQKRVERKMKLATNVTGLACNNNMEIDTGLVSPYILPNTWQEEGRKAGPFLFHLCYVKSLSVIAKRA